MTKRCDVLVVGARFTGAVIAERLAPVANMRELTGRPAPGARQGEPAPSSVDVRHPSRDER